jgi:hypothetical protein
MILASRLMAACKDDEDAKAPARACLEGIEFDPEKYRLGNTKARKEKPSYHLLFIPRSLAEHGDRCPAVSNFSFSLCKLGTFYLEEISSNKQFLYRVSSINLCTTGVYDLYKDKFKIANILDTNTLKTPLKPTLDQTACFHGRSRFYFLY